LPSGVTVQVRLPVPFSLSREAKPANKLVFLCLKFGVLALNG